MKTLWRQVISFVGLSGIGWILDFGVYAILGGFSKELFLNNIVSSWVGVTFVFLFSTRLVFQNNRKIPLKVKYIIYLLYQCLLIYLMSKQLNQVNRWILTYINWTFVTNISYLISKILITPVTMVLNFCVMKTVIEKI